MLYLLTLYRDTMEKLG